MVAPRLVRRTSHGVTLLEDPSRPGGVTFSFTERTGGVSEGCYASLNLGDACGDDPDAVAENRRRALREIGALAHADELVCPKQVHGTRVLTVAPGRLSPAEARREAREGADAIVCAMPGVPVLICCADCVAVILAAPGAFAVVHSGWRGTLGRISGIALDELVATCGCAAADVRCYIGPHVGALDYEVSPELAEQFAQEFGPQVLAGPRLLDLGAAITTSLCERGVDPHAIVGVGESTATTTDRFFSYRAAQGRCGRHGALAFLPEVDGR